VKEIKISIMKKSGRLPEGVYIFKKPNIWYPAIYFRKSKNINNRIYEEIFNYLKRGKR